MVEQTVQESNSSATTTFCGVIDAETIKRTVDVAHAVFDECHLYVDPDGLRLAAIDAATVVRADVTLERTAFESFEGLPITSESTSSDFATSSESLTATSSSPSR
ncbi:hypothetical protein ACFQMM_24180 [Saliphagus sp. GCM10025308]